MRINRRQLLASAATAAAIMGGRRGRGSDGPTPGATVDPAELDRVVAAPVLRTAGLTSPVIIDSLDLLKRDDEYLVRVRSKHGAEGVSLTNPPRAEYLEKILKQLVFPFFIGKDARDLDTLLWDLYRFRDK